MAEKKKKEQMKSLADFDAKFKDAKVDIRQLARTSGFRTTTSPSLDRLLNGGLPMGTMVEMYGPPQAGKSTVALAVVGAVLEAGGTAGIFDLERGLDVVNEHNWTEEGVLDAAKLLKVDEDTAKAHVAARQSWLRVNGVDPFHPNFRIYDPEHGEEMFDMLGQIVSNDLMDVVVVDSVAAIITRAEMEGEAGESHFGAVAKLLSVELKKLMRLYSGNTNTNVIFINQVRDKIGYMQKGQKSTGGHALEHFVGTKIKFTKIGRKDEGDDVVTESRVKIDKSRYASAKEITMFVSGKRGLDTLAELREVGIDFGYIKLHGSWHYFFEEPMDSATFKAAMDKKKQAELPGFLGGVNGKAACMEYMTEHNWKAKMLPLVAKAA